MSWTYDGAGNLETETGTITASTYDAAGRLVSRGFTNNVTTDVTHSPTRGWIENIHTFKNGTGTTHQNLTYAYYADGMIQSVTSPKPKESWTYQYDDLNRLELAVNVDTPSLSQSFTYDEIGNILTNSQIGTYSYSNPGDPRPHAVTSAGSRSYVYNDAGQMTNRNGTVLQWNGDGKPSSIGNVGFVYDGVGNRLKKLSGGQQTRYIGGDYEIENNGTITKYLAGGKKRGNNFFIHHKDHLGSIQVVTNSGGWQVLRQKHKPFGDQHEVVGWHTESKGWIGEREEETELVYLNARYYDPEIGRFTAPDPLVSAKRLNRYSYSKNNPINFLDPSGLTECGLWGPWETSWDACWGPDGYFNDSWWSWLPDLVFDSIFSLPGLGSQSQPQEPPVEDPIVYKTAGRRSFLDENNKIDLRVAEGLDNDVAKKHLNKLNFMLNRVEHNLSKATDLDKSLLYRVKAFQIGPTPKQASINAVTGVITIDPAYMQDNSLGVLTWMLGHEIYHFVHEDDPKRYPNKESLRAQLSADLYGRRFAMRMGDLTEYELGVINSNIADRRRKLLEEKREERER